ncbi:sulfurtransferase TusA family protein [Psychrobacter immobilis]|uniref:sulfurtransferase TusA family protein n=1 Tax=Psychrobacter immobilis TaxID=498 RepID=UPI0019194CF2|nr:sulfurtransferase TusA family protein [Psychrobacter immobilis]
MSADRQSTIVCPPQSISVSATLSGAEQQKINHLLSLLIVSNDDSNNHANIEQPTVNIKRFVDGRGLACPMPLLKTKVALRDVADGESLYVVATDSNSQADITAFCRQNQQADTANKLLLTVNNVTSQPLTDDRSSQHFDTIYHFIITKTDSN